MGQKINPIGFRLGINRTWDSRWYANTGEYGQLLHEDLKIRKFLEKELKQAAVSKIVIERPHKKCRVTIHSARPGIIIGKKGADIEKLRKKISNFTDAETHLNIVEVRKPEVDATLVAQSIAQQLERRVAFRRAMKRAVQSAMRLGAQGIKITSGGRLGGAEIARSEVQKLGSIPLQTLDANVDYGVATSRTGYGAIGIKVWIYKGKFGEEITPISRPQQRRPGRGGGKGGPGGARGGAGGGRGGGGGGRGGAGGGRAATTNTRTAPVAAPAVAPAAKPAVAPEKKTE